jgi:uncharacterized protein with FMN-binding domain
MKRSVLALVGSVIGLVGGVLMTGLQILQPAVSATAGETASSGPQTAQGDVVQTQFGPVQVEVVAEAGAVTSVTALQLPENDGHSMMISRNVEPVLSEQALTSQSAQIAGVSGATYTSVAYQQSLQSALDQLGL